MKKKALQKGIFRKAITLAGAAVASLYLTACGASAPTVSAANPAKDSGNTGSTTVTEEAGTSDDSAAQGQELQTLRFGSPNNGGKMLFELLEVALEQGILDEELASVGYKGEYYPIDAAGPGVNEALAAGNIEIAVYGDFPATSAKANGIDTTVIGVANGIQPQAIFVRDEAGINSIQDLEGKIVAVGLGTNYQFYWENFVNGENLDLNKIQIVNSFDYATLLTTGDVDAASVGLSQAIYFEQQGLGHTLVDSKDHPDWTTEFLVVASTPFIKEHPEVGVAINRALIRARKVIEENEEALYEAGSSQNYPAELIKAVSQVAGTDGYNPALVATDTSKRLQNVIDLMYNDGLISTSFDAKDWVDSSYYEKAAAELQ